VTYGIAMLSGSLPRFHTASTSQWASTCEQILQLLPLHHHHWPPGLFVSVKNRAFRLNKKAEQIEYTAIPEMTDHSDLTSDRDHSKLYAIRSLVDFRSHDGTHDRMTIQTQKRVLIGRNDNPTQRRITVQ
jgi:hypothetical protein